MADYPDPDEEYELMYADDLELMRDEDDHTEGNVAKKKPLPAKRSLDFSSPGPKKHPQENTITSNENSISNSQISLTPNLEPLEELLTPVNVPNKRTAEDLFGDIGDIDFDEVQLPSKRQKTDEENDLELIEKIIEGRRLRQILAEPSSRLQNDACPVYDAKENMSVNIPRWNFIPLTNSDGDRIYVKLQSEETWDKSLNTVAEKMSLHSSYVSTWVEARKILETKQKKTEESLTDPQPLEIDTNTSLWVDKYRPDSYLDLLSEEPVNRALLHWLHLWDKIVFKKEVKTKEPQQRNSFSKRFGQFQMSNKWRGKKESEPEIDEDGRPHHKVALLCGPPGVGKTTLAHLLARLAGYRPVELNASDERSTEAFRSALQSATLMTSVLDAERRPNCLILDEIDGAPLPTVELLVKWCTAAGAEGGKKKKTQPLRRPVIAICNDLYATSLRPLRPVSLVVHVGGVPAARLCARLERVARREGLGAAPRALAALAARACGDVRAALLLLSFVRARAHATLTMEDVENAAIGTKDCSKNLMQALTAIFTLNEKNPDILKTVQAAGEYDRLADGIFENYLTSRVDSRLSIACETLAWLRLHDAVHSWTMRKQNYSLYGMLPMCVARCHAILATRAPQRMRFPMQAMEMSRKKAEIESIVHSVWRGSCPRVCTTRSTLQLDLLPLLPHLLSPALRSNNVQLCSESERKALLTSAGAMCDYGLQYVQQRTPDGLYAFVLEPDIYRQAFFGNEERARPPPAVRQAIAREQQLEMIRRSDEMAGRVTSRSNTGTTKKPPDTRQTSSKAAKDTPLPNHLQRLQPKEVVKITPQAGRVTSRSNTGTTKKPPDTRQTSSKAAKDTPLPNHLQRLQPKEVVKITPQVHKDFFGRIVPLSQVQRTDAVSDAISSSSVFYQYREGFNNAVRRNVRTRDML